MQRTNLISLSTTARIASASASAIYSATIGPAVAGKRYRNAIGLESEVQIINSLHSKPIYVDAGKNDDLLTIACSPTLNSTGATQIQSQGPASSRKKPWVPSLWQLFSRVLLKWAEGHA
ncbi:hypothetical protein BT96DRAFT_980410 [Gymnopus androsaceus JB14]|uniref:Uncharacterized protein n=1 Tax=Gymnopus androsaceus JB14 TaxID=1447944 RepID=A0A6A4GXP5_9AGAR|nr:hypothetical protein BT96DRAFT_980410 [Gymnopus androsaceus JB14]